MKRHCPRLPAPAPHSAGVRRALATGLVVGLGAVLATTAQADITAIGFPTPAFRPNEPGPTRSTRAELSVELDASPSRYRLDVFRQGTGNQLVSTRSIDHQGPLGTPIAHPIRVPLNEGSNSFTARAVDLNRPRFAMSTGASPILTRDTQNTATTVTLDRVEPTSMRVTNSTTASLVFTIHGLAEQNVVEVERNGMIISLMPGVGRGEQRIDNVPLLLDQDNFFRVRVTSADPLSSDPMVTSNLLRLVQDGTPPVLVNTVVANPPLPTTQAVITIQGDTESFAVVTVEDPMGNSYAVRADQLGNFSISGVELPLLAPGPTATVFQVTARDDAGNVSLPVALPATRTAGDPRFEFIRLEPPDGSRVTPEIAARIRGLAGLGSAPYDVNFRVQADGLPPAADEQFTVLADGTTFEKDVPLTPAGSPPNMDVPWSFEAFVESGIVTSTVHFLGIVTLDVADPPAATLLDPDFATVPAISARSFTIEGAAERFSSVQFVGFNGVQIMPSRLVPTQPTPIGEGAEFRAVVDIASVADGEYSLASTVIATSGRTGLDSRREVLFRVDRTPPRVATLKIDDIDAELGRDIFRRAGQLVTLRVQLDEAAPEPPEVYVTQQGAEAVRAILGFEPVPDRVFEYQIATDLSGDFDGLVEVVVVGGADAAGNVATLERRFPDAFLVDTRAPVPDDFRSDPPDGSLITGRPERIRITLVEPMGSADPASGPDPANTTIQVLGPLEIDPLRVNAGTTLAFDSQTVDFLPAPGTFVDEGTYSVEIGAVDRAGNLTTSTFVYTLDSTPPSQAFVLATTPSADMALATTGLPTTTAGAQFVSARFDISSPDDLDLDRSSLTLTSACPVPFEVQGTSVTVLPDTRRLVFDENLAADGSQDGVYSLEVVATDPAGNMQLPVEAIFLLDNVPPLVLDGFQFSPVGSDVPTTAALFPLDEVLVRGPLREVSTLIQDGVASSGYTGSGVLADPVTGTRIELTLVAAHPTTTAPVGTSTSMGLASTQTIQELPELPLSPCFLGPRRGRVFLGLNPDPLTGAPQGLPADGTFDGEYTVEVTPIDRAGNVGTPVTRRFVYDTVPPFVEVDLVLADRVFTGSRLALTGRARDNDKGPGDIGQGLRRVQVRLEATSASGTTTLPPLIDFTDATLTPAPELVQAEELLPWRIDVRIPAYSGPARLLIRAEDMAGNETFLTRDLILDVDPLPPPRLVFPVNRDALPGAVVPFEWEAVDGASQYEVTLVDSTDNATVVVFDRASVVGNINLAPLPEDDYTWTVRAVDTGGTLGTPAAMRRFRLDRTMPAVTEVYSFDGTVPDASAGRQYGNQVRIAVEFSEPMDTTTAPTIILDPSDPNTPELPVTAISFDGQLFRGVVDVPPSEDFPDVNGLATVIVRDTQDRAGNPLPETRRHLEIDIGPFWDVRAFANPIHKAEVLFHFKSRTRDRGSLEEVAGFPHVTIQQAGAEFPRQVPVRRIQPAVFSGVYTVDRALSGLAVIRITGTDPQGNTSTRALAFSVAAILRADETNLRFASGAARVRVPAGAVREDTTLIMVSPAMDGQPWPEHAHLELELVRPLAGVLPARLGLDRPARLDVDLQALKLDAPEATQGLGLYLRRGDQYALQPSVVEGGRLAAATRELGALVLMRDVLAPRLRAEGEGVARAGSRVRISVEELGSGTQPGTVRARLGGRNLATRVDPATGAVEVEVPRSARPGQQLEVEVEDRAGNLGRSALPVAGAASLLGEAAFFPNPARMQATLRYQLLANASRVMLRIYDAAGRRIRDLPGAGAAGRQRIGWDLRTRRGRRVANGVYLAELLIEGPTGRERRRLKLAVLR